VLCARCKGNLLCGRIKCPLLEKFGYLKKVEIEEGNIEKPTPPSAFIGRIGYPKVYAGPLIAVNGEPSFLDSPWLWKGDVGDVIKLRMSLLRGMKRMEVYVAANPDRYLSDIQEATASVKPLDLETEVEKVIKRPVFDDTVQPVGVSARIQGLKLTENPKIPDRIEKVYYDDSRAVDAVKFLFDHGFSTYYLQKIFSVGMLGETKSRKLVPTRWSITAIHDILGEEIKKEIACFESVDKTMLFSFEHFGNHFEIILSPGNYSFQLVEIWLKKSFWSPDTTWIGYDREDISRKREYSVLSGGYYAARLPVLEHLRKIRRVASIIVLREIRPEYYAPLGVWVVEEGVRKAMQGKAEIFESLEEALTRAANRLRTDRMKWEIHLRQHHQSNLGRFFEV